VVRTLGRGRASGGACSSEKAVREEEEGWNERTPTGLGFITFTNMLERCRGVLPMRGQPCNIPPLMLVGRGVV
jgi:hypothetical protein